MELRDSDWFFANLMFAVMEIEFIVLKVVATLLRYGCTTINLYQGFFNILEKSRN